MVAGPPAADRECRAGLGVSPASLAGAAPAAPVYLTGAAVVARRAAIAGALGAR